MPLNQDSTTQEIYDWMLDQRATDPLFEPIRTANSPSQTAHWRLWAWMGAWLARVMLDIFGVYRTELQAIADRAAAATLPWYRLQALRFQWDGSNAYWLDFDPDSQQVRYNVTNPAARIVQYAAATEVPNGTGGLKVLLKVAAANPAGDPTPLPGTPTNTATALGAFIAYTRQIKPAGIRVDTVSLPPDLLTIAATVWVPGTVDHGAVRTAIEAAVLNYLRTQIPFNGRLYRERLRDAMQAALLAVAGEAGDVELSTITADVGGLQPVTIGQWYDPVSGYYQVNPNTPLSATLLINAL